MLAEWPSGIAQTSSCVSSSPDWVLLAAAAAPAIVHVDQVSAVRAGVRRDLAAQKCLRADLAQPRGIRRQIDAIAFAVSLLKRLHALAWAIRARRAGE
jgi:hypothetical protein